MVSQGRAPNDTVEKSSAADKYLVKCAEDARGDALSMVQSAAMSSTQNAALALYSESGDVAVFKVFHTPAAAVQFLEAAKSRQSSLLVRDTVCWECIRVMAEEDVSVDKAMHQVCPEWNGDETRIHSSSKRCTRTSATSSALVNTWSRPFRYFHTPSYAKRRGKGGSGIAMKIPLTKTKQIQLNKKEHAPQKINNKPRSSFQAHVYRARSSSMEGATRQRCEMIQ